VQYLLVGGTAVAFHGYVRPTTNRDGTVTDRDDFDFWYNPRYYNYHRLIEALEDLGLDMTDVRNEEFVNLKRSFFRHHFDDFTIDFIPTVGGNLTFIDCYKRRLITTIGETEIAILCMTDLILSKKAAGRKKDLDDINVLQELLKNRST
jgi:hypothetical protein